jgi:hypothetical protein
MGFERYVDYALSVPMYFIKRGDEYIDVAGSSFRDLLAGKLPSLPGERATISDWANHLSTIFPEVRLKRYLEMRGADDGPRERICALSALWTGVLYDQQALDAAWDLVKGWSAEERQKLRDEVPRLGFNAAIRERKVRGLARDMISLARAGLQRRPGRSLLGPRRELFPRSARRDRRERKNAGGSVTRALSRRVERLDRARIRGAEILTHSAATSVRLSSPCTMWVASASASAEVSWRLRNRPMSKAGRAGKLSG